MCRKAEESCASPRRATVSSPTSPHAPTLHLQSNRWSPGRNVNQRLVVLAKPSRQTPKYGTEEQLCTSYTSRANLRPIISKGNRGSGLQCHE
jgi:hypothetical protein